MTRDLARLGDILLGGSLVVLLVLWTIFGSEGMKLFEWGQVLWVVFGAPLLIIGGTLRVAETKDQLRMRPFFKVIFFVLVAGWLVVTVMFVCVRLFE